MLNAAVSLGHPTGSRLSRWMTFSVCGILILRGTQGWLDRAGIGQQTSILPDVLTLFLAVLALIAHRRGSRPQNAAGIFLTLFIVICTLSAIVVIATNATNIGLGVYGLRSMVFAPVTILLFQVAAIDEKGRKTVAGVLLAVVLLNCVVALGQAIFGFSAAEMSSILASGSTYLVGEQVRLIGLQTSGQDFSVIAGSAAVWGLATIFHGGIRNASWLTLATTAASSMAALLALQRSVLIGVAVAAAVMLVGSVVGSSAVSSKLLNFKHTMGILAITSLGVIAMATLAPLQTKEALDRVLSFTQMSSDNSWAIRQRTTIPVTLRLIEENPWGYGVGASGSVAAKFGNASPLAKYRLGGISADNGYLFVTLQVGVIGLLFFVLLFLAWMIQGRLIHSFSTSRWNAAAVMSFLAGSMVSGSFWGLASTMTVVLFFTSVGDPFPRNPVARGYREPSLVGYTKRTTPFRSLLGAVGRADPGAGRRKENRPSAESKDF